MSKELVAGRSALKRTFREFFAKSIDDGRDTRSFLSFKKQKEAPVAPPWIFLFHGDECLGKTTAIDYCISIADETATDLKQTIAAVSIDWDDWEFARGSLPATRIELLDAVAQAFLDVKGEIATAFSGYKKLSDAYRKNSFRVEESLRSHQLDLVLGGSDGANLQQTIPEPPALSSLLSPKELELHENGESRLAELLVSAIAGASDEIPLLFSIDSYDRINPEAEEWFRREIIGKLAARQSHLTLLVAGGAGILRNFRNEFSEDALCAYNLADNTLTCKTISLIASKKRVKITEDQAAAMERATAGIPFLVNDLLFHLSTGEMELSSLIEDTVVAVQSAEELSGGILSRFFEHCSDTTTRERVCSYAMFSQYNPKALAEAWNIPFADVKHTLSDLERQVSFIRGHGMHHHLRRMLRDNLIQEAANGEKSALKNFFTTFSANSTRIFSELTTQLQTAIPSAEKRCHDQRYLSAIEQLISGLMWSSPTDALITLPGYYIELLHFNPAFARKMLTKIAEFRVLFSPANEKTFKQLISGIHLADKTNIFTRATVRKTEDELIEYIDGIAESMNDFQRALFYHLKGSVEYRKGNHSGTMELLDKSFSLLGNSSPEKGVLYEEYVLLGSAFILAGEHRNAIATFSNAVLIHADGFVSWYSMGIARIALNEYEGAANALSEAVKIDPVHTDAWYLLGLALIHEKNFEVALDALLKAAELSPERSEIWFEIGRVYLELSRQADAVTALRKVVLAQSDHCEAWVLLGNANSALGASDEAIEAYTNAIGLKPKQVEPLRALGEEYFKLEQYEEAVTSFKKAAAISKKDPVLWSLIAESYLGAGQFEDAITAGEKAIRIDETDARAWNAIGDAHLAGENTTEAVEAFLKATETDPDNADLWFKLGSIYNDTGDDDAAIAAFKKAVAFNPGLKEVWYTIGLAYENQEKYADAIAAFEKGIAAVPQNADCWLHKGGMHTMLEQFEDAFDSYTHVVDLAPDSIPGWFNRGASALTIGNARDAVSSFGKVVSLDPDNTEGWYQLGCSYKVLEEYQDAIRSFTEAANRDDRRTDIWFELGYANEMLGIFNEAVQAYERCADIDDSNALYPTKTGECRYAQAQYTEAHNAYMRAVELDPYNNETLFQLALTCHAQENYQEAVEHYNKLLEMDPERADAQFNLALAYHAIGDYTSTIETYLDYIKQWPENSAAWFNLGLAYHAAGHIDDAIATYKEATKVAPDNVEIWYHLGMALHSKEQFGDAIQAYRKVVQLNPEHIDAWFNLGLSYYIWQNFIDAVEAYREVVKHDPQHSTAWGNLAIACFAVDDFTGGLDAARHAFELTPEEPWIIGNMVLGTLFSGDSLQAQEYVDRLFHADPAGEIRSQIVAQIRLFSKKQPQITGTEMIIDRLENGVEEAVDLEGEAEDMVPEETSISVGETTIE